MPRLAKVLLPATLLVAGGLAACGSQDVSVPKQSPAHHGGELFAARCSGCHTLDAAGAQGTTVNKRDRERVDGPNLNVRKETVSQVLYAVRNGGFSGAIMPQNIVVGPDAAAVARFVAEYAGRSVKQPRAPSTQSAQSKSAGG